MKDEFSKDKRGAVVEPDPNKVRITIRLDSDIIEHLKKSVHGGGIGNYQTLINYALRESISHNKQPLEKNVTQNNL